LAGFSVSVWYSMCVDGKADSLAALGLDIWIHKPKMLQCGLRDLCLTDPLLRAATSCIPTRHWLYGYILLITSRWCDWLRVTRLEESGDHVWLDEIFSELLLLQQFEVS